MMSDLVQIAGGGVHGRAMHLIKSEDFVHFVAFVPDKVFTPVSSEPRSAHEFGSCRRTIHRVLWMI